MSSPLTLNSILGSVPAFIDACHAELTRCGFDAPSLGCEMDHVCYRTETTAEYRAVLDALVPAAGEVLVESMIGGRPIATVRLHRPVSHGGYSVSCVEVPCPKEGSPYRSGLEHAEIVVGSMDDGVEGNARVRAFVEECERLGLGFKFKTGAMNKEVNADVSHAFALEDGRRATIKFHARPLYEVVEWEKEHDAVVAVPADYFK
mmetsp:Transcript_16822/g.33574  ORF Transcript_16822/g.33574 Transcript_16822/m.33574 type:complete len:204 (-) Transcript_16822:41-652(-)